jgi:hypothetical protein
VIDHRKLGRELELFHAEPLVGAGLPLWLPAGAAARYAAEQRIGWPLLVDPGSKAALDYGVYGVPETFVISPEGTIVAKRVGPVGYAWLTDRIEAAVRDISGTSA